RSSSQSVSAIQRFPLAAFPVQLAVRLVAFRRVRACARAVRRTFLVVRGYLRSVLPGPASRDPVPQSGFQVAALRRSTLSTPPLDRFVSYSPFDTDCAIPPSLIPTAEALGSRATYQYPYGPLRQGWPRRFV